VLQFRTFRNDDPPRLAQIWNAAFTGRSAVVLRHSAPLEHFVFAKPYFEPAGLLLALDGTTPVGFAHAGFGPTANESALATDKGVICVVAVVPSHRHRGIGSALLQRSEAYLINRGARTLYAGPMSPLNPFYLGLYGGSGSSGFLLSDTAAEPFLTRHGYCAEQSDLVYQARLSGTFNVVDGRFAALRRRFEIRAQPKGRPSTWWQACVLGPLEMLEFCLDDKLTNKTVARATVWEMDGFSQRWNEAALGLASVEVCQDLRRQGVAKYLLSQAFRYLQDQYFTIAEARTQEREEAATKLLQSLSFRQVDTGRQYRREA
jgi:ribosomal protein S18 acetylase RimI-like enzyme